MKDLIGRKFHFTRAMVKQEPSVRFEIDEETQTIRSASITERSPREEIVIVSSCFNCLGVGDIPTGEPYEFTVCSMCGGSGSIVMGPSL